MKDDILIRIANVNDVASLVEFNKSLAFETEDKNLDTAILTKGVQSVFDDETKGFYVVAEDASGAVVGGLMVTNEWSDWRNAWFWWIVSVYILPVARGKRVYSKLYEFVKERARGQGDICGYRLYVDIENVSAQKVYEKVGMQASQYLLFEEDA